MPYPVTFKAEYVEKRSRLTTFFRLILAIPHFIVVFFYILAAECRDHRVVRAALHGSLPAGDVRLRRGRAALRDARLRLRVPAHRRVPALLGRPGDAVPRRPEHRPPKAEYSRLKVLFRIILMIPVYIIGYAMQIVAQVGALLAWFAIVILGRQPKGLQDMIALGVSYQQRAYAYFVLLTEDWPPFTDDTAGRTVEPAPAFGALPRPPGRGPRAPDLGAARRLRLARARGGLPVRPARGRARARAALAEPAADRRRPRPRSPGRGRPPARARAPARSPSPSRPRGRSPPAPTRATRSARSPPRPAPPGPEPSPPPPRRLRAADRARPALARRLARPRARAGAGARPAQRRRRGRAAARPVRAELDEPREAPRPGAGARPRRA